MDRSRPLDLRRNDTAVGSRLCPPVHATAYNYRAPPRAFSSFHPLTYKRQQPVSNPSRRSSRILFLSSRTCAAPLPRVTRGPLFVLCWTSRPPSSTMGIRQVPFRCTKLDYMYRQVPPPMTRTATKREPLQSTRKELMDVKFCVMTPNLYENVVRLLPWPKTRAPLPS